MRAFDILTTMGTAGRPLNLREVADRTDMDRATTRRYLITLQSLGYLAHDDDRYRIQPRVLQLAREYLRSDPLVDVAEGPLRRLRDTLDEACSITVLSGERVCFVQVQNAAQGLSVRLSLGNELPVLPTAMGRVLLSDRSAADLNEIVCAWDCPAHTPHTVTDPDALVGVITKAATDGYAVADQELELGVRSVAVPILDQHRTTVAALAVSVPSSRVPLNELSGAILTAARSAATEITTRL